MKSFCPFPYTLLFLSFDYGRAGRWAGKRDGHGHWIPNARNRHWLVRMNASHKQRLLWTSGRKLAQPLTSLCGLWIFFLMSLGSQIPVCSKQKNWVAAWGTRDEGCYFGHWLLKKFKFSCFNMSCFFFLCSKYIHSFSHSFSSWLITGYWIQFPVLYSGTLLFIYFIYSSLYLLIPNS